MERQMMIERLSKLIETMQTSTGEARIKIANEAIDLLWAINSKYELMENMDEFWIFHRLVGELMKLFIEINQ